MSDRLATKRWLLQQIDVTFARLERKGIPVKCADKPEIYVDFKPAQRPSPEGAARLCAGCPALEACDLKAHLMPTGEASGVYGGRVWVEGVIQTD